MFSTEVEECMRSNGNVAEARFCQIIREGLYEAEDSPGIPALERCRKRLDIIKWLSEGVSFGDFPPYGGTIKGLSSILYEGLRTSMEAKLYLYALAKKCSCTKHIMLRKLLLQYAGDGSMRVHISWDRETYVRLHDVNSIANKR